MRLRYFVGAAGRYKGRDIIVRNRDLTKEAFDKLLLRFDSDRERAGQKYELVCAGLSKFFECRGCSAPYELTDETVNRVARKVAEGEEIPQSALSAYFYGVARNVLKEFNRSHEKSLVSIDGLLPSQLPVVGTTEAIEGELERLDLEKRLKCLDQCVKSLPPETGHLIVSYYQGEEGAKIQNRKRLAKTLDIPLNSLRIRVHRIREKLEQCVVNCVGRRSNE